MKILITGGAGFIGKYLTKYLIENKNEVTIFDNFSNSSKNEMKKELDGVPFIEGDIRNLEEILKHLKNYDMVIHLAAKISVTDSIKNPKETFDVNVEGTKNILKACDKNELGQNIFARIPLRKITTDFYTHQFLELSLIDRYFYPANLNTLNFNLLFCICFTKF